MSVASVESDAGVALLSKAVDMDVNFIDTADVYGPQVNDPLRRDAPWRMPPSPYATPRFPLDIERNPLFWEYPAETAGASNPMWVTLCNRR